MIVVPLPGVPGIGVVMKFNAHTLVQHGSDSVKFAPGDDVPDWAVEKVGDHLIDTDDQQATNTQDSKAKDPAETSDQKDDKQATEEPDFTKPAAKGQKKTTSKG